MADTVTTHGEGRVLTQPDYVDITFHAIAREYEKADALAEMTRQAAILDELIDATTDTILRRRDSAARVVSKSRFDEWNDNGDEGSIATRSTVLRLATWGGLADLIRAAVERAGVTLHGPEWGVESTNAAYSRARTEASIDARAQAEAYCAGLGVGLGAVREVQGSGGGMGYRRATSSHALLASASARGAAEDDADGLLSITPPDITIEDYVTVTFELASVR